MEELTRQSLSFDHTKNLYSVQRLLFAELARIDPEKSLNLVWETAPTRWSTFLNIVAMHWGMVSPEEALRTFSLLGEPWRSQAIEAVFDNQRSFTDTTIAEVVLTLDIADHFARWNYDIRLEAVIDEPTNRVQLSNKS